jgi:hypothetical protein
LTKLLEPRRVGGGVFDGVLNVPMAEKILNQPFIRALIGKGKIDKKRQLRYPFDSFESGQQRRV